MPYCLRVSILQFETAGSSEVIGQPWGKECWGRLGLVFGCLGVFSWTGSDSQAVLELSQGEGWAERSAKVADKLPRAAGRREGQGGGRHLD